MKASGVSTGRVPNGLGHAVLSPTSQQPKALARGTFKVPNALIRLSDTALAAGDVGRPDTLSDKSDKSHGLCGRMHQRDDAPKTGQPSSFGFSWRRKVVLRSAVRPGT